MPKALTEADWEELLYQDLLPPAIRQALAGTSLLFVGYT
jgi:hypothetical protein